MKKVKINFDKNKFKKKMKKICIAFIIAILIEILICNYPAIRTLFSKKNIEAKYKIEENKISISNIDERITNISFDYKTELKDKITYKTSYVSEDSSLKTDLRNKVILEEDNHYINLDTHVNCKSIEIILETNSEIKLEKIILNKVCFNINFYRVFILFIISSLGLIIKDGTIYKTEYDKNSKRHNFNFVLNLLTFCGFCLVYIISQFSPESYFLTYEQIVRNEKSVSGIHNFDSILMQTEAIINGQIELLVKPTEELLNMENPYDHVKRADDGIFALYDVAYYDGDYYNYFGIAPILVLILPFRLITGKYLHTFLFNFVFFVGIAIGLYYLYKNLIDRYVKKISLGNFYLGYYSIFFGANFLTLLRGAKYDIVVTSGIMFLLLAMNLAIASSKDTKLKYLKLVLLGITTGLVVLSKPNLIIYYPLIAFLYFAVRGKRHLKEYVKELIWVAIPLAGLAVFQMILNYVRFDNILEFGAKYQLTSFNMIACMGITFGKSLGGILEYIFRTPIINPLKFPFVFINTDTGLTTMNEVCYENRVYGLIAISILWVYLVKSIIIKKEESKEFKGFINLGIIVSVLGIILATSFGGICEAYCIDFKMVLCIGAVLLLLKLIEQNENNELVNKIFIILTISTIILMIPIGFTTEMNFLDNLTSSLTVFLKNIFEFWV